MATSPRKITKSIFGMKTVQFAHTERIHEDTTQRVVRLVSSASCCSFVLQTLQSRRKSTQRVKSCCAINATRTRDRKGSRLSGIFPKGASGRWLTMEVSRRCFGRQRSGRVEFL